MKLGTLALLILSSLSPLSAYGRCEPRPSIIDEHYLRGWPIIMYGLVIEAHQDTSAQYNSYAVLELESIWEGDPPNPVHVYHSDSAHGFKFEKGKSYLVFAYEEKGRIEASICSPTCVDFQCTRAVRLLGEPTRSFR